MSAKTEYFTHQDEELEERAVVVDRSYLLVAISVQVLLLAKLYFVVLSVQSVKCSDKTMPVICAV